MTAVALGSFPPPTLQPDWLRPAAIAAVVALHVVALATLPYFAETPPAPPMEVVLSLIHI